MAETAQKRAHHHHAAAETGTLCHELLRLNVRSVHLIGLEGVGTLGVTGNLHAHIAQKLKEILDVQDFRDVGDFDRGRCKQHGTDYFQGFILCALRSDGTGQFVPAFDYEFCHIKLLLFCVRPMPIQPTDR